MRSRSRTALLGQSHQFAVRMRIMGINSTAHVGRSVGRSMSLFPRFLSNRGCCRYQTWICGYVQRALGTARVWSGVVQEQLVYGGGLKLYTVIILGVHLEIANGLRLGLAQLCQHNFETNRYHGALGIMLA